MWRNCFCVYRVLLWSLSPITEARAKVDDSPDWIPLTHVKGPLYVAKWTPNQYTDGLHTLEVRQCLQNGGITFINHSTSESICFRGYERITIFFTSFLLRCTQRTGAVASRRCHSHSPSTDHSLPSGSGPGLSSCLMSPCL